MPVYNSKPVTAWADPSQSSVMDSPLQQALRLLGQMLGGSDPSSAMPDPSIGMAPLIATVPREAAETLVPRLLKHWTDEGSPIPEGVQEAVEWLARKFPRVSSHIDSLVELSPKAKARGKFETLPWVGTPGTYAGNVGVKPGLDPRRMRQTLTHEATHVGQSLRDGSRNIGGTSRYSDDLAKTGYWNNPAELRARIAQLNQEYREMGLFSDNASRLKAATVDAQKMGDPLYESLGEREAERLDRAWR